MTPRTNRFLRAIAQASGLVTFAGVVASYLLEALRGGAPPSAIGRLVVSGAVGIGGAVAIIACGLLLRSDPNFARNARSRGLTMALLIAAALVALALITFVRSLGLILSVPS